MGSYTDHKESDAMKKLMLEAIAYNWGLCRAGDVHKIVWEINYDMTYAITTYVPVLNPENKDDLPSISCIVDKGVMRKELFDKLRLLADKKLWRTRDKIDAYDGLAWDIRLYSEDGSLLNSSGKTGYIYNEEVLEKIVAALPTRDKNNLKNHDNSREIYTISYFEYLDRFR